MQANNNNNNNTSNSNSNSNNQTQKEKDAEKALKIALLDLGYGHNSLLFLLLFLLTLSFFFSANLLVESMRGLYDVILEEFPSDFGKAISKKEREEKQLYVSTLIYGEIDFDSFGNN